MEHFKRLSLCLLLLAAFPVVGQEEESRVYFSLASDRTYAPGEAATVQLWGQGIKRLQFRLYRVNDPVKFFENLDDDHNFGGRPPQRQRSLTPLERFRAWKLRQRAQVRKLVRAQFTVEARRQYAQWRHSAATGQAKPSQPTATEYAGVPVLNPQQLVATWEQPFSPANRWESAQVPVPVKGKGLYLVEATDGNLSAYTIVSVSGLAIIAKGTPGKVLLRTVERESGKGLEGIAIQTWGRGESGKRRLAAAETDRNGYAELPVTEKKLESLLVTARRGEDFAALSTYGGNVSTDEDQRLNAYVYTDRPVYRPGHTVYYKAIVRSRDLESYRVPAGRRVNIEVQDSDGKAVYRTQQTLSSMGTLHGQFTLPATATLGHHSLQVQIGQSYHSGSFDVEEYKKPEYEVRVTPETRRVTQGNSVPVRIEARYYYGEPVPGAKVTWVVHRSRYWLPYYADELDDGETPGMDADSPYVPRQQVSEETATLDASGTLTITVPTAVDEVDFRYRIEARVTDAAGREISGVGSVLATVGSYFIHVSAERYVYAPGEQAGFEVETRDYDGNPVPNTAFTLELLDWQWGDNKGTLLAQRQGVTGADGKARLTLPVSAGSLRARVRSKTPEGREVQDTEYLWVSGAASSLRSGAEQRLQIATDKKSYKPGDTAKVLVVAGEPGTHLWVTVEGRTVWKSHFATATDGTVSIEVPITSAAAPNLWVTAVAMRHNRLLQGTRILKVPPVEHQLNVDLKPAKPEYKPGESAVYYLEAKDSAGRPAANAEFSIGVVDEAVYAVRPEIVGEILPFFYGREWNRVNTDSSISYYFHGEAGKRRMQLARVRPFRPNAQLKPDRVVEPKIRRLFPDTAFWAAEVRTDSGGKAQVKLDFPDALTTWRATTRGVTADTKVGSAVNRVVVRKNLLTRLAVPRFFRQGDTVTLKVITQNLLPTEKQARISLEVKGLELVAGQNTTAAIAPKAIHVADYQVKVPAGKEAVLVAKALTDEESDALELTIPIVPYGAKMADARGGSFTGQTAEASAEIQFPASAEPGSLSLEVSATPSVAASLFDALDYLTTFPYGCTEQTMSSFLPNVVVSRAVKELGLTGRVDEADLQRKVRAGLERLAQLQHDDGGWGWWRSDDSEIFMTAYVVAGLAQAKAAGLAIDNELLRRGAGWLQASSAALNKAPADLQAYAEYALALAAASAVQLDGLYGKRRSLNSYALALTGLALDARNDQRAAEIAGLLESQAKTSDTEAWWEAARDDLLGLETDATPEASAWAMKLLSRHKPGSELLPKAAVYLVNHRSGGYYWNSTKQTAMVIFGLIDYLKQSGELKPNFSVSVFVNDQLAVTRRFTASDALAPAAVRIPSSQLSKGVNRIKVVRYGEGRVYWAARGEYYSAEPKLEQRANLRLAVEREYFRLQPARKGDKIVYNLEPLGARVAQGDVVAVRLTVTGDNWRYLLIEDPLPAGAEAVERDDLYDIPQKPDWWNYYFSQRELRDDRVAFFQTYFTGKQQYFYLLKVVNPGQFRVSPARVEPMYQPRYFATSKAAALEATQ
jgi:uncharacterized protein YfaS (alpha-2-macroglobulin family)